MSYAVITAAIWLRFDGHSTGFRLRSKGH